MNSPIADMAIDIDAYRAALQQAIHGLHDLQQRFDRQAVRYKALLEELRALRPSQPAAARRAA